MVYNSHAFITVSLTGLYGCIQSLYVVITNKTTLKNTIMITDTGTFLQNRYNVKHVFISPSKDNNGYSYYPHPTGVFLHHNFLNKPQKSQKN